MRTARLSIAFALLSPWLSAASCGGDACPPVVLASPMTELRAHEIAPEVATGVAVSTTLVRGDCRPVLEEDPNAQPACSANPACSKARAPLRVLLVPIDRSVPFSNACPGHFAVTDLAAMTIVDARASAGGELVAAVEAGRYTLYVSADDQCAVCGLEDIEHACVIDVPREGLAVRDLVLDQSTR